MNEELTGMPGDLRDNIVRDIKAMVPNIDYGKCKTLADQIIRTFIRHYEAEAAKSAD